MITGRNPTAHSRNQQNSRYVRYFQGLVSAVQAAWQSSWKQVRYTVTVHTYVFHKRLTHSHTLPSASFVTYKYKTRGLFSVHRLFLRVHKCMASPAHDIKHVQMWTSLWLSTSTKRGNQVLSLASPWFQIELKTDSNSHVRPRYTYHVWWHLLGVRWWPAPACPGSWSLCGIHIEPPIVQFPGMTHTVCWVHVYIRYYNMRKTMLSTHVVVVYEPKVRVCKYCTPTAYYRKSII